MEYPGHALIKRLTETDVRGRLVVPTEWVGSMLPAQPDRNNIPIKVLDDDGHVYQFYLSVRRNGYLKPVFQAREWKRFIQYSEAKVGDEIYFWYEVNELRQTQYRIRLLRDFFRPRHPGL